MIPSLTEDQVEQALGLLLQTVLPSSCSIIIGQTNRVPTPEGDYAVFWPLRRPRLGTNLEMPEDCTFTASIAPIDLSNATMTVTVLLTGEIQPGNQVSSIHANSSTVIQSQTSGTPGGAGIYVVTPSQTVTVELMSAGALSIEQSTEAVFQVDVHGPKSADNVQVISTIMRSGYAVDVLEGTGVTPLYADEPRQMPFTTAAEQFENRWMIDVHLQINPTISTPQEFSDTVDLTLIEVDTTYPA